MKVTSRVGWAEWLNQHETRASYDSIPDKVTKLCGGPNSNTSKFEKLVTNKNLVMLTKAALGKKCQATFLHSVVGISMIPDSVHYVARTGMKFGLGVELHPDSLFHQTTARYVPTLLELMKVSKEEEYVNLRANEAGQKKKVNCYAILTPALAEAAQGTDMSPAKLLIAMVDQIRAKADAPDVASTATAADPTDDILKKMGASYESTLQFLWACHHLDVDMIVPTTSTLQDQATVDWEEGTRSLIEEPKVAPTVDLTTTGVDNSVISAGALTAMTKLSESMTKYQEAAARLQDEKSDVSLKHWNKLPQIQKNIILLGGIDENNDVPAEPTEEMLAILGCQNGAQVEQYLKQVMTGHNLHLEPGFCSAINKGIFVHADDTTAPKHFSCFLTPPISDDEQTSENNDLLKLAVQTKYTDTDVTLLTKMIIQIPMKTQDLRHHMKNIAGLSGRCFGVDSLLHQGLKDVATHIESKELQYNYEFRQDRLFGGNFLDRIHWRMHRFFDSCAAGINDKIDVEKLDFSDILQQVERREYNCKPPAWVSKLIAKREKRHEKTPRETGKRRFFDEDKGQDGNRPQKINNPSIAESCKLKDGEQHKYIFHPGNIRRIDKPMKKNGNQICLRFHCSGFCFKDCKFAGGHGTLDNEEKVDLLTFMAKAREARKVFANRNRPRAERDQAPATAAGQPARAEAGDTPAIEGEA